MSSTPALATEALTILSGLVKHTSGTPEDPVTATGSRGGSLRTLALLIPVLRLAIDEAAADVGSSPLRAAAFLSLAEAAYREAGYGQLLAASRAGDAQVHTISEEPLAALNAWLRDPEAAATSPLPADVPTPAGCKPLFREDADFLEAQLNLTHFQAQHRVLSAENLLPHTGFNGRTVPAKFPLFGQVLSDGAADPKSLATLAKKFEGLGPEAGAAMEAELAEAARTRNTKGTGKLLKDQAKRLDGSAAATAREAVEDLFVGAYYLGHTRKGYEYKVITTAEGHELLATAADILNSPRTKAGTPAEPTSQAGPPIPDWAVDPGTPPEERPAAGFTDLGVAPELDPMMEMHPGETIEQALTRQRARRLHQLIIDSVRIVTSPAESGSGDDRVGDRQMPLAPNVTLNVTIDLQTFLGQLEAAGVTDRGEDISAASCRRIACNAGIIPIVLNGARVPLELGRSRRYFNRAQRRAIAVRDKGCINPGCTMTIGRCEAHHLDPWNCGGRTDVSRGCLLCPSCHQAYHAGRFRIEMIGGHPHVILPRSRDPLQIPRRNWIFHPAAAPAEAA
ncbi:hypothetical protein GCM10009715_09250 [Paeniglutamicibacter psychrophenolicus]|uniref:HNH nuclease domain-containing protein n=1 Tax=Paeniglutamicibacter psychrophenolicus TaxID=257454 RepID=A0ABS4WG61_9MICC|nr:HNH endonuclease signature motif containing protein [Paeniglutamicibacter psychrophenolicus]MBP2375026.1 hypothetical protein [Paeniglutamicibacter psychrophenolicus]